MGEGLGTVLSKRFIRAGTACAVLALIFLLCCCTGSPTLKIINLNSGETVWEGELEEGEAFSVSYTHSVNKSDVNEEYQLRGSDIYLINLYYSAFGAGMTTDIYADGGLSLSYTDDGRMVVAFDKLLDDVTYSVARSADLILHYRGELIHFTELAEPGELLHFEIE